VGSEERIESGMVKNKLLYQEVTMGIFNILEDIIEMPIRVALDVIQMPGKVIMGEDGLIENTKNGIKNIEDELKTKE
jgi:hypothetical protein